ncbi:hypothetical protein BRUM_1078 [Bifidobacterium ruminantium]|uniref:Uncharacterized protein n=1 Tax=Bifidobacterium ruminantium TaxID=78346 RepID=A0A087D2V8_BIFRU|nr:hypothetical protein BRUM_1078 [Bifidobacterium ruminantium]
MFGDWSSAAGIRGFRFVRSPFFFCRKVLRLFLADANDSLVIVLFHMEPSAYCAIISIGLFPSISLDACGLLSVCAD